MGQVQRRQQQDIELWELYGEEEWEAEKGGRNSGGNNGRGGRDKHHEEARRRTETDRNAGRARQSRNAGGRRRQDTYRNARRYDERECGGERQRTERSGSGRIRLYEIEQNGPRPGNKAVRVAERRTANTARQPENAGRARRAGRTNDISEISYIGTHPSEEPRRRNQQTVYRGNARPVQSIRRRRARRRKEALSRTVIALFMVTCLVLIYFITGQIYQMVHRNTEEKPIPVLTEQTINDNISETGIVPPEVIQDFLEINEYSRPGDKLGRINNIFVHYTANPGTSAAQNRSYFANLAETHERSASAHLIIGYEGELIQCIPFDEQAYAVMTRNEDSISIECCYLSDDGSFTQETYDTLIHTLAWLLDKYDLSVEDILRHYDCGGKLCPLYYAENEGAWDQLRQDVEAYLVEARQETT